MTGAEPAPVTQPTNATILRRTPMTTPTANFGLVLDCADPQLLADFWSAALDYVNVGAAGAYVALYPRDRPGPKFLLQRVAEPRVAKNRMHIDIEIPDIHAEVARLVALGATRLSEGPCHEFGSTWIMMADPEGNEFCVCDNGTPVAAATPG
jgi:predicted enzyme related to lactoylglutathione lyase